jgi:hypothetical protein
MQEGMGWGLRLDEPVVAGQLIREYVGEVLTDVRRGGGRGIYG